MKPIRKSQEQCPLCYLPAESESVGLMACLPLQRRVSGGDVMFALGAKCHFGRPQSILELKIGVKRRALSRTPRAPRKHSLGFDGSAPPHHSEAPQRVSKNARKTQTPSKEAFMNNTEHLFNYRARLIIIHTPFPGGFT